MSKTAIPCGFSNREIQVLILLCLDFTQQETADLLFISFETVRSHLRNMRDRHNVKKATRLFLIAVATGYVKLKPQPQTLNGLITSLCLN